jgi:hypothetical protein
MTDTMTSQNIDLSYWDILYIDGWIIRLQMIKKQRRIVLYG